MKKLSLVLALLLTGCTSCLLDNTPGPTRYHVECYSDGKVIFSEAVRDGYRSSGMWVYARHDGTTVYISGDCVNIEPVGTP